MPDIHETWSELTPDTCQVLLCDLQEEIVARSKTMLPDALSQSAEVLCRIAKLFCLPLTLSVVPEGERNPKLIGPFEQFPAENNQFLRASASPFRDHATPAHLTSQAGKRSSSADSQPRLSSCMLPSMPLAGDTAWLLLSMLAAVCQRGRKTQCLRKFGIAAGSSALSSQWPQR